MAERGGQQGNGAVEAERPSAKALAKLVSIPRWMLEESEDGIGLGGGGRYMDMEHDVILRMEVITPIQCKLLSLVTLVFGGLALAALIVETILQYLRNPSRALLNDNSPYFTTGLVFACILEAMLLFVLGHFALRLAEALRCGRRWSARRRRISLLSFAQLCCQTLNVALWVAITAYVIAPSCVWDTMTPVMLGWAQWTLWNTEFLLIVIQGHGGNIWRGGRFLNRRPHPPGAPAAVAVTAAAGPKGEAPPVAGERLILDAPMSIHASKLVLWVLLEVVVCLMTRNMHRILKGTVVDGACFTVQLNCTPNTNTIVFVALMVAFVALYLVVYYCHLYFTFKQLRLRPYQRSRLSNILFRIQAQQVSIVFGILVLSMALLHLLNINSCWTFIFVWFGLCPMHLAATSMCCVTAWFFMPRNPGDHHQILQVWLQELAWTAGALPGALAARNRHLASSEELAGEPMFCMELALRALYWSGYVYDYDEKPVCRFDRDLALGLYGLEGLELVWDRRPGVDMKVLVGWSRRGEVVVAFRGTSSFENVKTDLKLWQTVHPPRRHAPATALWLLRRIPRVVKVHSGFWRAYAETPAPSRRRGSRQQLLQQQQKQEGELAGAAAEGAGAAEAGEPVREATRAWSQGSSGFEGATSGGGASLVSGGSGPLLPAPSGSGGVAQTATAAGEEQLQPRTSSASVSSASLRLQQLRQQGASVTLGSSGGGTKKRAAGKRRRRRQDRLPFSQQLLQRVEDILREQGVDPATQPISIYLTGHSLGGAVASLAALDFKLLWPTAKLCVYTFGQPRVGNRAFASEYHSLINDHWAIVNDQDPVPRVPKTTGGYKRCGERVMVNCRGDLIVRPSYLETSVLSGAGVVGDHLMEAYRGAFAAVLKAQFTAKRLPEGAEGVEALCSRVDLNRLLLCEGLDLKSLRDETSQPVTREALERQAERGFQLPALRTSVVRRAVSKGRCWRSELPSPRAEAAMEAGEGAFDAAAAAAAAGVGGKAGVAATVAAAAAGGSGAKGGPAGAAPTLDRQPSLVVTAGAGDEVEAATAGEGVLGKAAAAIRAQSMLRRPAAMQRARPEV